MLLMLLATAANATNAIVPGGINVTEIAKTGTVGVVLLVVWYAWKAISKEQSKHDERSKEQLLHFTQTLAGIEDRHSTTIRDVSDQTSAMIRSVQEATTKMVERSEERSERQLMQIKSEISDGFKQTAAAISQLDRHMNDPDEPNRASPSKHRT